MRIKLVLHCCLFTIGLFFGSILFQFLVQIPPACLDHIVLQTVNKNKRLKSESSYFNYVKKSSNIYLGIVSDHNDVQKLLQPSIYTWIKHGEWKVDVFCNAKYNTYEIFPKLNLHIVKLFNGNGNRYNKKHFLILRYMYDYHIDDYEWFVQLSDDIYIDYDQLNILLRTLNSTKPILLVSPGFNLNDNDGNNSDGRNNIDSFIMVLNRILLIQLRPHLRHCIRNMFTANQNIEIIRCISKYTNAIISNLPKFATNDFSLTQIQQRIIYQYVKTENEIYQLHKMILLNKLQNCRDKTVYLQYETRSALLQMQYISNNVLTEFDVNSNEPIILGNKSSESVYPTITRISATETWMYFTNFYFYQPLDNLLPFRSQSKAERALFSMLLQELKEKVTDDYCLNTAARTFKYGYIHKYSIEGVRFVVVYQTEDFKHCTIMCEMSYSVTQLLEENKLPSINQMISYYYNNNNKTNFAFNLFQSDLLINSEFSEDKGKVVFIIPLQGRYKTLENFLKNYEKQYLQSLKSNDNVKVKLAVIVMLNDATDESGINRASIHLLENYQIKYGSDAVFYHVVSMGDKPFSRGAGLQLGSLVAESNDILFFMDIDMIVTRNLVQQCYKNAVKGKYAWYPIPYSQYDPNFMCSKTDNNENHVTWVKDIESESLNKQTKYKISKLINEEKGFWRDFGFGLACIYKSDFLSSGGYDLSIKGWGEEDVQFYLSLITSGLNIFRSNQEDLVHIFHRKDCSPDLEKIQADACKRTRASHYASQRCLSNRWLDKFNHTIE